MKTEENPQILITGDLNEDAALTEGQEKTGEDTENFFDISFIHYPADRRCRDILYRSDNPGIQI